MTNFVALGLFSVFMLSFSSAKQYACQQCAVENKNNCWGKKVVQGCDYCVKVQGTVTDVSQVPDAAKDYVKQNHPDLKLHNGMKVFGRGCITKQIMQKFDIPSDNPDCVKIKPEHKVGFTGDACTCLGNC